MPPALQHLDQRREVLVAVAELEQGREVIFGGDPDTFERVRSVLEAGS
ncbi:MAG: hypothetical protein ACLP0J_28560 [Solirubrobacteraceae bacterium]